MATAEAKKPTVLIVEDEYLVALQSEIALRDAGFEIVGIASAADEAVEVARSERPNVVIMDVRLIGDRDGIDAALEIYRATGIRCIFATAHSDPETRRRAHAAEPLGWLPKPYTPDQLARVACDSLKARR
jgi:DNA-binding NarL/FixJ family response regulator